MLSKAGRALARVSDAGTFKLSKWSRAWGYKAETTLWKNLWKGNWKMSNETLMLHLTLDKHECRKEIAKRGRKKKKHSCPAAAKRLVLKCTDVKIKMEPRMGSPVQAVRDLKAWRCEAGGANAQTGGTHLPWIFGKHRCIQNTAGRRLFGGLTYYPCK